MAKIYPAKIPKVVSLSDVDKDVWVTLIELNNVTGDLVELTVASRSGDIEYRVTIDGLSPVTVIMKADSHMMDCGLCKITLPAHFKFYCKLEVMGSKNKTDWALMYAEWSV
ncbi:MAG: hypothetical protein HQM11_07695 [SAR324 cluster bacterium]|nr:hypothetical protein [SAR324 cluster bacterium]